MSITDLNRLFDYYEEQLNEYSKLLNSAIDIIDDYAMNFIS